MGRTTPSHPVIAPSQRRDARAKRAKQTLNKDIPALLSAYPRARRGVEGAELIVDPGSLASTSTMGLLHEGAEGGGGGGEGKGQGGLNRDTGARSGHGRQSSKKKLRQLEGNSEEEDVDTDVGANTPTSASTAKGEAQSATSGSNPVSQQTRTSTTTTSTQEPSNERQTKIRIRVADTLEAAHDLLTILSTTSHSPGNTTSKHAQPHITILNMASPLRPGGGFLTGATSQEESLCMRTTLYPSLREEFYRLPEVGGVYTSDVLVFRGADSEMKDLSKAERWWVDVVSAGMLRFPEVSFDMNGLGNGEVRYSSEKDRELVEEKMRAVMRIVDVKGKKKRRGRRGVVLGAWGCGAYGNPTEAVARCWRRVLLGDVNDSGKERKVKGSKTGKGAEDLNMERQSWSDMEIVFAIKERKMALEFARCFGGDIQVEMNDDQVGAEEGSAEDEDEGSQSELQDKITELEKQIAGSRSEVQKGMLTKILQSLKSAEQDAT